MGLESGPLRILILEGEGLQLTSTLLNLDSYLKFTTDHNGGKNERPCDVFDCIAGTGMGGWLAILLGRFRMDFTSCLTEWFKIVQDILPNSKTEMIRMKAFRQYHLYTDRLQEHITHLTKVYDVGENLFETDPEGAKTRHVFVAASKAHKTGYGIFRTYETSTTVKNLCEGPKDPTRFTIARAFGVSGITRDFTYPVTEQMESSGRTKFSTTVPPESHNIERIALDEISAIYGKTEPQPIVTRIGPDRTNEADEERLSGGQSCGMSKIAACEPDLGSGGKSTSAKDHAIRNQASSSDQPMKKPNSNPMINAIGPRAPLPMHINPICTHKYQQTSETNNSTNMTPIDKALTYSDSQSVSKHGTTAKDNGAKRTTSSRSHRRTPFPESMAGEKSQRPTEWFVVSHLT
ncbi:MAG: hypothetical protein Q9160_003785 [Pyrenula sp. 1 TL-2023]